MLKTTLSPIIQIGLHIAQTAPTLFHSACIQATCRCLKAAAQISIGTIPGASDRAPSWTGADFFMRHWTKVRLSSYNGRAYAVKIYSRDYILKNKATVGSSISIGDVVQYLDGETSHAYHTTIISQKTSNTEIKFCAHTSNRRNEDWFNYIQNGIGANEWIVVIKISNS